MRRMIGAVVVVAAIVVLTSWRSWTEDGNSEATRPSELNRRQRYPVTVSSEVGQALWRGPDENGRKRGRPMSDSDHAHPGFTPGERIAVPADDGSVTFHPPEITPAGRIPSKLEDRVLNGVYVIGARPSEGIYEFTLFSKMGHNICTVITEWPKKNETSLSLKWLVRVYVRREAASLSGEDMKIRSGLTLRRFAQAVRLSPLIYKSDREVDLVYLTNWGD